MNLHAVARQRFREDLGGVALFLGQEFRLVLGDDDMRAQPAERLRQFASQRAAADHQETARAFRQIEHLSLVTYPACSRPGMSA